MYDYTFINVYELRDDWEEFQYNPDVVNLNIDNLVKNEISFTTLLHIILSCINEVEYNKDMCSENMWLRIEVALKDIILNNVNNNLFYYWTNILNIINRWKDGEVFIPAYDADISIYSVENLKTLKYYCENILKTDYEILTDGAMLFVKHNSKNSLFGVKVLKSI